MPENLAANLGKVQARIRDAAMRCGRDPAAITLLAVAKQQSATALRELVACGQRDIGENYLQEAAPKMASLASADIVWHYIGQIQSNKTRAIAEHFQWVHTVDRLKIAERLNEHRPPNAQPLNLCLQVKLVDEVGKGGVAPQALGALARGVAQLPRLRLRGLMCIPPPREQYAEQLADFAQCAALLQSLNAAGLSLDTLSMGMSADLEAAIAAGSTIVRVGTAIFGERQT